MVVNGDRTFSLPDKADKLLVLIVKSRFLRYSAYLRDRYGASVYRVPVDAGLGCPHRGEGSGSGCRFCGVSAGRAAFVKPTDTVPMQIARGVRFLSRRYRATQFLLYFQTHSGTNARVDELKELYDLGLQQAPFRELIVSTRPDCIDSEVVELLSSYKTDLQDVWVELGLQSSNEGTLVRINRCHTLADFEHSFGLLRSAGIKIAVHVMFGLPGEGLAESLETISYLNYFHPDGIKIHNVHVMADAALAHDFAAGEVTVPSMERHLTYVVEALQALPEDVVVMRLTCESDPLLRLAPHHRIEKQSFYRDVEDRLATLGARQGSRYLWSIDAGQRKRSIRAYR